MPTLPFPTDAHPRGAALAIKAKTRSALYDILTPIVGDEEVVNDLLAQFPARELDEPVARDFVRAEAADVRTEIAGVRAALAAAVAILR